jgi:hypothetical protein
MKRQPWGFELLLAALLAGCGLVAGIGDFTDGPVTSAPSTSTAAGGGTGGGGGTLTSTSSTTSSASGGSDGGMRPTELLVLQDPADALPPTDWTCVSCAGGELEGRYLQGDDVFGNAGGGVPAIHATELTLGYSSSAERRSEGSSRCATFPHTHQRSATVAPAPPPAFHTFRVLEASAPTTTLPLGAIFLWAESALPEGAYARYEQADGRLIRAGGAAASDGAVEHVHQVEVDLLDTTDDAPCCDFSSGVCPGSSVALVGHGHSVPAQTTNAVSSLPPHRTLVLVRVTSGLGAPVPRGGIVMMRVTPSADDWDVLSEQPKALWKRFLLAGVAPDLLTDQGVGEHTHASINGLNIPGNDGAVNAAETIPGGGLAAGNHQHTLAIDFLPAEHLPPYTTVILAKRR